MYYLYGRQHIGLTINPDNAVFILMWSDSAFEDTQHSMSKLTEIFESGLDAISGMVLWGDGDAQQITTPSIFVNFR